MASEKDTVPDDIAAMPFEDAMAALETIVDQLERGAVSLEQSIEIYTRGTWLRRHCEAKLREAEAKIETIARSAAGEPTGTAPFTGEQT